MKKIITLLFLFSTFTYSQNAFSQDPVLLNNYRSPLKLNPALTGMSHQHRFTGTYRNEWPGVAGNSVISNLSYDQAIRNSNFGAGISWLRHNAGQLIERNYMDFNMSYGYPLSRKLKLSLGVSPSIITQKVNLNRVQYGIYQYPLKKAVFDLGSGVVLTANKFDVGVSANHITQPILAEGYDYENKLPLELTAHTNIFLFKNDTSFISSVKATMVAQAQGGFYNSFGLLTTKVKRISMIAGYRPNGGIIGGLGVDVLSGLSLLYMYNHEKSYLGSNTFGSHELSIVYVINKKSRGRKFYEIGTPSF